MERIKNCPFCGFNKPEVRCYKANGRERFTDRYAVLCSFENGGCGAESGWYYSPAEAIAMWNQRRRKWKDD